MALFQTIVEIIHTLLSLNIENHELQKMLNSFCSSVPELIPVDEAPALTGSLGAVLGLKVHYGLTASSSPSHH